MQRVIVTVKREGEDQDCDLDVPAEVKIERLTTLIAQALKWNSDQAGQPIQYQIEANPPGQILKTSETLADAEAWDGTWLIFRPIHSAVTTSPPSRHASPPMSTPQSPNLEIVWHPLDVDSPSEDEKSDSGKDPAPTSGFVWKRLD